MRWKDNSVQNIDIRPPRACCGKCNLSPVVHTHIHNHNKSEIQTWVTQNHLRGVFYIQLLGLSLRVSDPVALEWEGVSVHVSNKQHVPSNCERCLSGDHLLGFTNLLLIFYLSSFMKILLEVFLTSVASSPLGHILPLFRSCQQAILFILNSSYPPPSPLPRLPSSPSPSSFAF